MAVAIKPYPRDFPRSLEGAPIHRCVNLDEADLMRLVAEASAGSLPVALTTFGPVDHEGGIKRMEAKAIAVILSPEQFKALGGRSVTGE